MLFPHVILYYYIYINITKYLPYSFLSIKWPWSKVWSPDCRLELNSRSHTPKVYNLPVRWQSTSWQGEIFAILSHAQISLGKILIYSITINACCYCFLCWLRSYVYIFIFMLTWWFISSTTQSTSYSSYNQLPSNDKSYNLSNKGKFDNV